MLNPVSLIPNQTNITSNTYFFLEANISTLNVNNLSTGNITATNISANQIEVNALSTNNFYAPTAYISSFLTDFISSANGEINELTTSTISTTQLDLDGQTLNATATELLLNGIPIATTTNLSSIADWSLDPAISTVNMNNNDLINANKISTQIIYANTINAINLAAFNIFAFSTYTSTISSLAEVADFGFIDTLSSGNAYIGSLSSATAAMQQANIDVLDANTIITSTIQAESFSTATLLLSSLVAENVVFSSLTVSSINGQDFVNPDFSTVTIAAGGNIKLENFGVSFASVGSAQLGFDWFYEASTSTDFFYDTTISSVRMMTKTLGGYTDSPASRIHFPETNISSLYISSINGNEFTSTSLTIQVAGVSSLTANFVSTIGAEIRQGLMSSIVFNPKVEFPLNFNFDFKPLAAAIGSGLTSIGVGLGGGLVAVASGLVALAVSRDSTTNINNNVYEQYATTTQLQFSTIGTQISSYFRYVSSSTGEGNSIPGQELIVSTIIPANTLCVRSLSDPINLADPSTVTSSIQSFGQWVAVPLEGLTSTFNELYTSSLTASSINTLQANVSSVTGLSSLNGIPISDYQNVSSISSLNEWALYPALSTISFDTAVPAIIQSGNVNTNNIAVVGSNIQLIAGFTDAKNLLLVSTLSTAVIQGANDNLFGLGLQGLKIEASNIFLSTGQTNVTGLINSSTITANLYTGKAVEVSSITASSISLAQTGSYGLSSLMYLSTSQLPGFGTSTTTYITTDVSLGQNDFFCQQIRLGYLNPSSQPSEIVFHSPNNTQRAFNITNNDQTIRILSTPNTTGGGYILDTSINPPFFSTINNQVNLMAFFPSTTASTIGVSTVSKMNPVTQYGRSTLAGGTVTIVFSPPYADSNEYSVSLVYRDTSGGAPMHANILSVSSFSANGSATNDFFWTTIGRV